MVQIKHNNILIKIIIPPLFLFTILVVYFIIAILASYIPINKDFKSTHQGIDIFVQSNGVHTDLILPAVTSQIDWRRQIRPHFFTNQTLYIAFGWGNKDFYINTPTWKDLKLKTAVKAVLGIGNSAIHSTYYSSTPKENESTIKIRINASQYNSLVEYIRNRFQTDSYGNFQIISGFHYTESNDNFYDAKGTYNLFKTCNTWTSDALKQAGIRTAVWAPFDWGVMRQVKKINER